MVTNNDTKPMQVDIVRVAHLTWAGCSIIHTRFSPQHLPDSRQHHTHTHKVREYHTRGSARAWQVGVLTACRCKLATVQHADKLHPLDGAITVGIALLHERGDLCIRRLHTQARQQPANLPAPYLTHHVREGGEGGQDKAGTYALSMVPLPS